MPASEPCPSQLRRPGRPPAAAPPVLPVDSVGLVRPRTVTLFEPPDLLELECGRTLGPIQVAYETCGTLSPARDNAVLVCHALSGDAHVAGYHTPHDRRPGWWEAMVGPGKGIDTNRYFVICANVLGGCKGTTGPSSINPATGRPWGLDFPVVTIEDMVKVQKRLVEHLGIATLLAVVGGSMGGMQVLEWAVRYPECVRTALAIATTPRQNAQSIAFDAIGRSAILADPRFAGGQYHGRPGPDQGLAIARMIGHLTYLSEEGMHAKFGRQLRHADRYRYDFSSEFSVETYLDHQGRTFVERFDANSYLYITKAIDYYDLTRRGGSLVAALRNVQARFLVVSFRSDWLFTPAQSRQLVAALLANRKTVSYCDIDSPYGHDAFLLEPQRLGRLIRAELAAAAGRPVRPAAADLNGPAAGPDTAAAGRPRRADYAWIEQRIAPGARVLDLGCGDGALLNRLRHTKAVRGLGVERDADAVLACLERGVPVIHGDLESELPKLADDSYDCVLLSQTLQTLRRPDRVLREMLRIGRVAVVSFPNGAYWPRRLEWLLAGRKPADPADGRAWFDTPNLRDLSIRDFLDFCRGQGVRVLDRVGWGARPARRVRLWLNGRAREAVFVIGRAPAPAGGPGPAPGGDARALSPRRSPGCA